MSDYIITRDGPISLELYHHGIKGMKWGVRRYQKYDGALTAAGKKRYNKLDDLSDEDFAEHKKKVLASGSAKDILSLRGRISNNELQTALNRINMENQLSNSVMKQREAKIESTVRITDNVIKLAKHGVSAYNIVAKITNSVSKTELPVIDLDGNKSMSKADKAWEKTKKRLIREGSSEEIAEHFHEFTTAEIGEIKRRRGYETDMGYDRATKTLIKTD